MIDLIRSRRSIRSYTDEPVDRRSVDLLVEALLRAPSSRSINPWEFVLVDEQELLGLPQKLRVEAIIAIGHPVEKRTPLSADKLEYDKVRHNRYSVRWDRP